MGSAWIETAGPTGEDTDDTVDEVEDDDFKDGEGLTGFHGSGQI